MMDDLYIKANPNPPDIPDSINGKWFTVPHPEYAMLPWWKKLWQRYWGWRNRNVEWKHVIPNWDGPRRVYFNMDGQWSALELPGEDNND